MSDDTSTTSYGACVRRFRKDAGLTMATLAEALGISVPYLSDLECGNRGPLSAAYSTEIARLTGGSLERLLTAAILTNCHATLPLAPATVESPEESATAATALAELQLAWSTAQRNPAFLVQLRILCSEFRA